MGIEHSEEVMEYGVRRWALAATIIMGYAERPHGPAV
jgi:hypothetical protein